MSATSTGCSSTASASAFPAWRRKQESRVLLFWCQISRDGWDQYAGAKLTVEFQLWRWPFIGAM